MAGMHRETRTTDARNGRRWARSAALRLLGFGMIWWVLAEGSLRYPLMALLAIAGATAASLALMPPAGVRWSPAGLARFIPYFARQSVIGGADVAIRALSPRMPINPGVVECDLRLPNEAARVLLAHVMSLMPGTLSVDLDGARLRLHVLDRAMPAVDRVRETEALIAGMFRLELLVQMNDANVGLASERETGR
jgi:multicomponent Na+:H+ antiporter subunit E